MRRTLAEAARTMRGVVSVERVRIAQLEALARLHLGDEEHDGGRVPIPHLRERLAVMGEIAMFLELAAPHESEIKALLAKSEGPQSLRPVTSS